MYSLYNKYHVKNRIFALMLLVCTLFTTFDISGFYDMDVHAAGQSQSFSYTGQVEEFVAQYSGKYKVEVWGAAGGSRAVSGGKGGYYSVEIPMIAGEKYYVNVGGMGQSNGIGGYNGGGSGGTYGAGGGGATAVTTTNRGDLSNFSSYKSEVVAVAGGGGGSYSSKLLNQGVYDIYYYRHTSLTAMWYTPTVWAYNQYVANGHSVSGLSITGYSSNQLYTDVYSLPGSGGGNEGSASLPCESSNMIMTDNGSFCRGATVASGYAFGQGGSNVNGAGGGGGYYGGYAGTTYYASGSGGSGYVVNTTGNSTYRLDACDGNGHATITYMGDWPIEIIVHPNGMGTYKGQSYEYKFNATWGSTVTLDDIVAASGYTFIDYVSEIDSNDTRSWKTFILDKSRCPYSVDRIIIKAHYIAPLVVKKDSSSYNGVGSLRLSWYQNDNFSKRYSVYQSKDGVNWYDAALAMDAQYGLSSPHKAYTGAGQTYTYRVPFTGEYRIRCYGGRGGNGYKGSRVGYGANGAYTDGTIDLTKGQYLYIHVGRNGSSQPMNNGANVAIGQGGNASDVCADVNNQNNRIMVAAGGGAGAWYICTTTNGTSGGTLTSSNAYVTYLCCSYCYATTPMGATQARAGYYSLRAGHGNNQNGTYYGHFNSSRHGAGGGGLYSGIGGGTCDSVTSGSGGTSFISGAKGCVTRNGYKFKDASWSAGSSSSPSVYIDLLTSTDTYNNFMDDITFYDTVAPNLASNGYVDGNRSNESNICVTWNTNGDNGNKYYHKVVSYDDTTNKVLRESNILEDYLVAGVQGCYYYYDTKSTGTVTTRNSTFTKNSYAYIPRNNNARLYMHVAVVDKVGNMSGTYSFEIPQAYTIRYNGHYATSGSMANQTVVYGVDARLNKNQFVKNGFTFRGWTLDEVGTGHLYLDRAIVNSLGRPGSIVDLYAQWNPITYYVTYDKYVPDAAQFGPTKVAMQHKLVGDTYVDAGVDTKYCTYLGWNFIGWGEKDSHTVYNNTDNRLKLGYSDITLYGVYNRSLRLNLASDVVTKRPAYSYDRTIWNLDNKFVYDSDDVISGTTRVDGKYTVVFENNGNSRLYDTGNTETSTNFDGSTIVSYPTFEGWYCTESNGVKIGDSSTSITVTPSVKNSTEYTVTGDCGSDIVYSNNNNITIYPHWSSTTIKLPGAKRNEQLHGLNGRDEDKFLGWFTKPQPVDGGSGDGGRYIGTTGEIVTITSDMTLYPWFNIAPSLTASDMPNYFYEGQPISYDQLLTLVNAFDTDDPYVDDTGNGDIYWNGIKSWQDMYRVNVIAFLHDTYPNMSEEQCNSIMNSINYSEFKPVVTGVTYYSDSLDRYGESYSDIGEHSQNENSVFVDGLLTTTENIGNITIHYAITDNGILSKLLEIPYSEITVNFDLNTSILFDNPPVLSLNSVYIYTDDPYVTDSNIDEYLISKHTVSDREDDVDYKPWWYKDDVAFDNPSDNTKQRLFDNIYVVGVYDINFSSGYYNEHKAECDAVKAYTNVQDLFKLKTSNYELFSHITNFKVELDTVDQWNKPASIDKYGMSKMSRTFEVIMFNNADDYDLDSVAHNDSLRYINSNWVDTLGETSYWRSESYGLNSLLRTFNRHDDMDAHEYVTYLGEFENHEDVDLGRTVNVTVHDFTDNLGYVAYRAWTYNIEFDGNGSDSGAMSSVTVPGSTRTSESNYKLPPNQFSRTGYDFAGWSTESNGRVIADDEGTVRNLSSDDNGSVVLYARWRSHNYTVKFDGNTADSGIVDDVVTAYDRYFVLPRNGFVKDGYKFDSWNTKPDGTGITYHVGDKAANLTADSNGTVTLYAIWDVNKYVVRFNGNGATSGEMSDIDTFYNANVVLPENQFVKTGNIFSHWTLDESSMEYYPGDIVTKLTNINNGIANVYANWNPIHYKVVFHGNGATVGEDITKNVAYDEIFSSPSGSFSKVGHYIIGWNTKADGSGDFFDRGTVLMNLTEIDDSVIDLYAVWDTNAYSLAFYGNDETSGEMNNITVKYSETGYIPECAYVKTGYTFVSWNTSLDGTGTTYNVGDEFKELSDVGGSVIPLYAQWIPNSYSIKFVGNGSDSGNMDDIHLKYGAGYTLPNCKFTRVGYDFDSWNTCEDGTGESYANGCSVKNLTSDADAVITLYAQWKPCKYKVYLQPNGGEVDRDYVTVTYDDFYGFIPTPTREGHDFLGWYTKSNKLIVSEDVVDITSDITLIAKWKAETYTIKFNACGGMGTMDDQIANYGRNVTLHNCTYYMMGQQLLGWSFSETGDVAYTNMGTVRNLALPDETVTLYAVWGDYTDISDLTIDNLSCSHNWVDCYDDTYHWKECAKCKVIVEKVKHEFVDHWSTSAYTECSRHNYSNRTCDCGYSYTYYKPCVWDGTTYSSSDYTSHCKLCSVCGDWIAHSYYLGVYGSGKIYTDVSSEPCVDADGNPFDVCSNDVGTCSICGTKRTTKHHMFNSMNYEYTYEDGFAYPVKVTADMFCDNCGEMAGTGVTTVEYRGGTPETIFIKSEVKLYDPIEYDYGASSVRNYNAFSSTEGFNVTYRKDIVEQPDGSFREGFPIYTLSGVAKFNTNIKSTYGVYVVNKYSDNTGTCIEGPSITVVPDRVKPVITHFGFDGQTADWNTNPSFKISGTENYTSTVTVSIVGNGIEYYNGDIPVKNGKFDAVIDTDCEATATGTEYVVTITDACGNIVSQSFDLYNVDSIAPTIEDTKLNSSGKWYRSRDIIISGRDIGSGNVEIGINNLSDLKLGQLDSSGAYVRKYTIIGDCYDDAECCILLRDAAGNVGYSNVILGKFDYTAPTVRSVEISGNVITIQADDINASLEKEGSGVARYGYISDEQCELIWFEENEIELPEDKFGEYQIYVQDNVGNISSPYTIVIGD